VSPAAVLQGRHRGRGDGTIFPPHGRLAQAGRQGKKEGQEVKPKDTR
jgi:hypothetical protein